MNQSLFRIVRHVLFPLGLVLIAVTPKAAELKTALVIGNNNYPKAPLDNSVNDARAVSQALTRLGFQTTTLLDAPEAKINEAVATFVSKGTGMAGSTTVFYFSGHGVQFKDRNWMLATDVNPQTLSHGIIDIQELLAKIKPTVDATNIVILDACRNYAPASSVSAKALAPLDAPPGTLIAYSTAPGRFASDGGETDKNGVYTKNLLRFISQPSNPVEAIFKKIRTEVIRETKGEQIPWESSSLTRDFYFNPAPPGYIDSVDHAKSVPPIPEPTQRAVVQKQSISASRDAKSTKQAAVAKQTAAVTSAQAILLTIPEKLPEIVPPTDSLSSLYSALVQLRNDQVRGQMLAREVTDPHAAQSVESPVDQANRVLKKLTGIEFTEPELLVMSSVILTINAVLLPVPDFARPMLGLQPSDGGLLLGEVKQGGVAHRAGIMEGDVLLRVNGKPIFSLKDVDGIAGALRSGEVVYVTVMRNRRQIDISGTVERSSVDDLIFQVAIYNGTANQNERMKQLLTFAANRGHGDANAWLANLMFNEAGVGGGGRLLSLLLGGNSKYVEAVQYAKRASEAGAPKGDYWLAMAYLRGLGVEANIQITNSLREKWAVRGAAWANAGLGLAYLQGQGMVRDYVKARHYLEQAAAQAHFDGMLGLGIMYEEGLGVSQDKLQATAWFERALAIGNIHAKKVAEDHLKKLRSD